MRAAKTMFCEIITESLLLDVTFSQQQRVVADIVYFRNVVIAKVHSNRTGRSAVGGREPGIGWSSHNVFEVTVRDGIVLVLCPCHH